VADGVVHQVVQQPPHQLRVPEVGARGFGDRHPDGRARQHLDRVAGADLPLLKHAQVSAGPAGVGEPLDPLTLVHPAGEDHARDPGRGDLNHGRADPPHLPDQAAGDLEPAGGDVLAEGPAGQFPAQPFHPPVQVLPGVGVKSLLVAAVVRLVHLLITGQAEPADRDRPRNRPLVDRGALEPAGPLLIPPVPGVD